MVIFLTCLSEALDISTAERAGLGGILAAGIWGQWKAKQGAGVKCGAWFVSLQSWVQGMGFQQCSHCSLNFGVFIC